MGFDFRAAARCGLSEDRPDAEVESHLIQQAYQQNQYFKYDDDKQNPEGVDP